MNGFLSINFLSMWISQTMLYFLLRKRNGPNTLKILINGVEIKEKKSIKYLGVIIDSNLKWKDHVHELSKKLLGCFI